MATGVLPFVRGVDFSKNDFSVSLMCYSFIKRGKTISTNAYLFVGKTSIVIYMYIWIYTMSHLKKFFFVNIYRTLNFLLLLKR